MLLEKKFNDCGELGIKRGLTRSGVMNEHGCLHRLSAPLPPQSLPSTSFKTTVAVVGKTIKCSDAVFSTSMRTNRKNGPKFV